MYYYATTDTNIKCKLSIYERLHARPKVKGWSLEYRVVEMHFSVVLYREETAVQGFRVFNGGLA